MSVEIPIGSMVSNYRVERLLGRGAMGTVYLARDVLLDRLVALKLLAAELARDERFRTRFLRESRIAARLDHPGIVPIYAAGEADGILFLAMRYVEGADLRQIIKREGVLDTDRVVDIVRQVAEALDAAHEAGLVHRDVKPGNIMVDNAGRAYLCDFGLAKHSSTVNSLTRESAFVGTIDYIAPEQIQGGSVDGRADEYALGCVLYESLTGSPPFHRDSDLAVVFAHLKEPPPLPTALRPELADGIDAVVSRALAKHPAQRYPTCAELAADAAVGLAGGEVDAPPPREATHAFLITDIRGYTRYTQQHGDDAAAQLSERFIGIASSQIQQFDGRVMATHGDEVVSVFESPRRALRAALAIQAAVAEAGFPLGVGVGLDAGEAVEVGDDYRGGALNTAARLCSAARGGEVLASEPLIHLARRVDGITYLEGRIERLKGIEQPVKVVEVVSAEVGDSLTGRIRRRMHGRRWGRVLAGAAVVVAGLAGLLSFALGGGTGAASFRPGLVLLDIKTRHQVGYISPSQIAKPAFPLFAGGHLWMMNFTPSSYVEIDLATGKVLTQFAPPSDSTDSTTYQPYAVAGKTLWTGSGHDLVRMDTDLGKEVERFHLDKLFGGSGTVEGVALGGGLVWVSRDVGIGQIIALDPTNGKLRHRVNNVAHHVDIAYGNGRLWTADFGGVSVIDPSTNTVTTVVGITSTSLYVLSGGGFGWTSDPAKGVVYKINRNAEIAATYHTGLGASNLSYSDGVLWVANQDVGTVTGINAITGTRTTQAFGHPVGVAAAGAGVLLTSLDAGPTIDDRFAALGDNVARLFSQQGALGQGDEPALNWNPAAFQVDYATCANLLRYPDAPAPEGLQLRPEVAAAMPRMSPDGRTYTFSIRPGYRFSPPTNQPLTAETFRHSIERALSPKLGDFQPGAYFVDDIRGEQAFRSGKSPNISGLRASGSRLQITLTQPSPTFRQRLALPFFCPVPTDTAFVPGAPLRGAGRATSAGYIPSAGPYYVADYNNDKYVILKRNPNYHGPRPHALDAIALREGVDTGFAVDQVQHGGWHGIVSSGHNGSTPIDPLIAPRGAIASRYQANSANRDQYAPVPLPGDGALALNTGRAPFADSTVRRAVAVAIDRTAIAAVWDEVPSDHLLPPMFPEAPRPAQTSAPQDLQRAETLMEGRRVDAVMAIFKDCDPCAEMAHEIKAQLGRIGIRVTVIVDENPFTAAAKPGARIDILDTGVYDFPYPDSAGWLRELLITGVPAGWVPAQVRHAVTSTNRIQGPGRQSTAAALADRLTTSRFPVVPYGITVQGEFLAPTLGCRVFPPFGYGVDLAALCLTTPGS